MCGCNNKNNKGKSAPEETDMALSDNARESRLLKNATLWQLTRCFFHSNTRYANIIFKFPVQVLKCFKNDKSIIS